MPKKTVIIDTNFLLIPGQFMVDIFTEIERIINEPFELCMIDKSIGELNKIVMTGSQKDKFAAKLALALARQKSLKSLHSFMSGNSVDDMIVSKADSNTIVATQDAALRRRVREKGAGIIGLRQKKYLVMI